MKARDRRLPLARATAPGLSSLMAVPSLVTGGLADGVAEAGG